jgi:hypothetical protein
MASGLRHPYSRDLYEPAGQGRVRVTRDSTGEVGFYAPSGRWIEGAKFDADPHLCGFISGPRTKHRLAATPEPEPTTS